MAAFDSIVEFIRNQHHGHPIPLAILVGAALGESIHDAHQLLFHPLDVMRKKVAELKPPSTGSWFLAFFKPFRVFIGKSGRVAHDQSQPCGGGFLNRVLIAAAIAARFFSGLGIEDVFPTGSTLAIDLANSVLDDSCFMQAFQGEVECPWGAAGDHSDFRGGPGLAVHQGENDVPAGQAGNGIKSFIGPEKARFRGFCPNIEWSARRHADFVLATIALSAKLG